MQSTEAAELIECHAITTCNAGLFLNKVHYISLFVTQRFVGLCICLLFGIGLIGAIIVSLVVDATRKFEEAAKIGFGLCACSLIALVTVSTVLSYVFSH